MIKYQFFFLILIWFLMSVNTFEPNWDSLDSRPIPSWYEGAKVGIFLHWGVYSVPSFGSDMFWANWKEKDPKDFHRHMKDYYPKYFSYQNFARKFRTDLFEPLDWAELLKDSGAKYVVLSAKHHEGFPLWPSTYSYSWNSMDIGPHRDIVGELSVVIKDAGLKFGIYYSLYEWYNPMYLTDRATDFEQNEFVTFKVIPELKELVRNYRPELLWADGDWEAPDSYWNSTDFLAWLFNESPVKDTVVVNDRWGRDIPCKHGGFYTCDESEVHWIYRKGGKFQGVSEKHKWENSISLDKSSWGFRRNAQLEDYLTTSELLSTVSKTISHGGNILINVGPARDGTIIPIMQERLLDMGKWLKTNTDAIFNTQPWIHQSDSKTSNVHYTQKSGKVFAVISDWPKKNNTLTLGSVSEMFAAGGTVEMLGFGVLPWSKSKDGIEIKFPRKVLVKDKPVWVLKIH